MKYSSEEALSEIMKRSKQVVIARERRTCQLLLGLVAVTFAGLIAVITTLQGENKVQSETTVYGAFLLRQEAGAYVLTAMIAFALGIIVTLLCLKYKKQRKLTGKASHHEEASSNKQGGQERDM